MAKSGGQWLDNAPYWFWADKWKGELKVIYRLEYQAGPHKFFEKWDWDSAVIFDKKESRKFNLTIWDGENDSSISLSKKGKGSIQGASGYLDFFNVFVGEDNCKISKESGVWMDISEKKYWVHFLLDEDYEIEADKTLHLFIEGTDGQRKWVFNEDEKETVHILPHLQGVVEKGFPEPGDGLKGEKDQSKQGDEEYLFTYDLEPEYDKDKWRSDYRDILYTSFGYDKYGEMLTEYASCGTEWYERLWGKKCRLADRNLRTFNANVEYLIKDGMRIAELIINQEAPWLLSMMKRNYRPNMERYVKRGAAATVNQIHKYIFYLVESLDTPMGLMKRMPSELRRLYPDYRDLVALFEAGQLYKDLN